MSQLKITQVRSTIGSRWKQRESLRTLGLRKIRQSVVREDTPATRGLIARPSLCGLVLDSGDRSGAVVFATR